jgi:hypothetical protein
MTVQLTEKETIVFRAFLLEGCNCNGATTAEELIQDNMTWMSATDIQEVTGWNKQAVGGVMAALSDKGMISDSGESARGARDTDWTAENWAIEEFWHLTN